ncbi:alpha-tubulin suppressor-like RCC1 family protein [Leucobacter luti]|nr:alpha-tubulin suppressor-like RCC1 family protein [Leucobacter luti]
MSTTDSEIFVNSVKHQRWVKALGAAAISAALCLSSSAVAAAQGPDPVPLPASGPTRGATEVTAPLDEDSKIAITPLGTSRSGSFGVDAGGRLYAWGATERGQLGVDLGGASTSIVTVPREVALPEGVTVVDTAFGGSSSIVLGSDGKVYSWGSNAFGELGNGSSIQESVVPVQVLLPETSIVTHVANSGGNGLALMSDGTAYSWGRDDLGVIGDGQRSQNPVRTPVPVKMPPGVTFTSLTAGAAVAIALDQNGGMWTWGLGDRGSLGDGQTGRNHFATEPTKITLAPGVNFTTIYPGNGYTWAKTSVGEFYRWGRNAFGELATGGTSDLLRPTLFTSPGGRTFTEIVPGVLQVFGRTASGELFAWGDNNGGVLGNGTTNPSLLPIPSTIPSGVAFAGSIVAGQFHNLAVGSDGTIYAWGQNQNSQFGDGSTSGSLVPTPITLAEDPLTVTQVTFDGVPGTNVRQVNGAWIATSPEHGCAVVDLVVYYQQGPRTWSKTIRDGFTYGSAPDVTEQPTSDAIDHGDGITLRAAAIGDSAPTVQWQQAASAQGPWSEILGATETTFTVTPESSMFYRAAFTNCLGTTISDPAQVTVTTISTPPVDPTKPPVDPTKPPSDSENPSSRSNTPGDKLAATGASSTVWGAAVAGFVLIAGGILFAAVSRRFASSRTAQEL